MKNVDAAVDCLRPLFKRLSIKENPFSEKIVYTVEIPELDVFNLGNCSIIVTRERLTDSSLSGQSIVRYDEPNKYLRIFINLNEHLFFNEEESKKNRRIVATHEFTHVAAHLFAYSENVDKDKYFKILEKKFPNTIDEIHRTDVNSLRDYFDNKKNMEFNIHSHIQHSHFALESDTIGLSFTDLYYALLFSKGTFEEYFDLENQNKFYNLWQKGERNKAVNMYREIVMKAAEEEWVSKQFAMDQAFDWLKKYTQNPIK